MFQIASFKIICTNSTEILFSKLTSAGLNYHLPKRKFFLLFLNVRGGGGGVSNKHCILPFFINIFVLSSIYSGRLRQILLCLFVSLRQCRLCSLKKEYVSIWTRIVHVLWLYYSSNIISVRSFLSFGNLVKHKG